MKALALAALLLCACGGAALPPEQSVPLDAPEAGLSDACDPGSLVQEWASDGARIDAWWRNSQDQPLVPNVCNDGAIPPVSK